MFILRTSKSQMTESAETGDANWFSYEMFDTRQPCSQNTRQPAKKTVFSFSLNFFLGLLSQQVVQVKKKSH